MPGEGGWGLDDDVAGVTPPPQPSPPAIPPEDMAGMGGQLAVNDRAVWQRPMRAPNLLNRPAAYMKVAALCTPVKGGLSLVGGDKLGTVLAIGEMKRSLHSALSTFAPTLESREETPAPEDPWERLEFERKRSQYTEEVYQFEKIFLKERLIDQARREREDEGGDKKLRELLDKIQSPFPPNFSEKYFGLQRKAEPKPMEEERSRGKRQRSTYQKKRSSRRLVGELPQYGLLENETRDNRQPSAKTNSAKSTRPEKSGAKKTKFGGSPSQGQWRQVAQKGLRGDPRAEEYEYQGVGSGEHWIWMGKKSVSGVSGQQARLFAGNMVLGLRTVWAWQKGNKGRACSCAIQPLNVC
ncbi:hypothetical protein B0T17DRAFT_601031 [Bombardia bombarda]|uniref:Uncharacterized protein n=1 Tax=Bombardia bombarda TaxID=252184 RepID=A0AA39WMD0_9PEZI|nr:hypothetical protein B0T17DRAFT_601031 [Bombardia bombarda]